MDNRPELPTLADDEEAPDDGSQISRDALEFGRHFRQGGWRLGLLVARNVTLTQGKRTDLGTSAEVDPEAKVSAAEFARRAGVSQRSVKYYLHAWTFAAMDGYCTKASELKPGEEDNGISQYDEDDDESRQRWSYYYRKAKGKGSKKQEPEPTPAPVATIEDKIRDLAEKLETAEDSQLSHEEAMREGETIAARMQVEELSTELLGSAMNLVTAATQLWKLVDPAQDDRVSIEADSETGGNIRRTREILSGSSKQKDSGDIWNVLGTVPEELETEEPEESTE